MMPPAMAGMNPMMMMPGVGMPGMPMAPMPMGAMPMMMPGMGMPMMPMMPMMPGMASMMGLRPGMPGMMPPASQAPLKIHPKSDWREAVTESGEVYYFNVQTSDVSWDVPEGYQKPVRRIISSSSHAFLRV